MDKCFESWTVKKLQLFLRERGVSITGYVKKELVELSKCVANLRLPADPNLSNDSLKETLEARLKDAGCTFSDPFHLSGFTKDFAGIPDFGLYDVFNYLICFRADYDRRKLRAYKSFEDYRLFSDGNVLSLEFNNVDDSSPVCVFRAEVKPTQKDKTYLKKDTYNSWLILQKESGDVKAAYCECQGGSDGACRHIAAALYEIDAFERASVTDGPSLWAKRARDQDRPAPIRQLSIRATKYGECNETSQRKRPFSDVFDPRHPDDRSPLAGDQQADFVKRLKELEPECGVLELLSLDIDAQPPRCALNTDCMKLAFLTQGKELFQNAIHPDDLLQLLVYTDEQVNTIYNCTKGQSANPTWVEMRKGILTASNFKRVYTRVATLEKDPTADPGALLRHLMGEQKTEGTGNTPAALKWGRDKEEDARTMYYQVEKKQHKKLVVNEAGLLVDKDTPYLGCSPDGVVQCSCHEERLVEIKCPYALRDATPKDAAKERGCVRRDGTWYLKQSSPYYTQIQGQLGISKLYACDLVVYTMKGILVLPVDFNKSFYEDLKQRLVLFYQKYMFSYILAKWRGD